MPELRRGFFFVLADGLALRFIDVVDWQGSRNSRMESNMEVAWVSRGLYLVSPERKLLRAMHPPTIDIDLQNILLHNSISTSALVNHFLCRSQSKQSSAAANAKPT